MKRKVGYAWRLREVMAQYQIFTATELVPLLRERGIDLSASQIHHLVFGTPERLSLQVMAALRRPVLHPGRPGGYHGRERRSP
ncbi:helix-turn-helix domain-containing protein [Streptomyces sp. NPDC059153]|uniref:helix-turn-helix domain-containing protein n=1 Tax=unclassified Streptomyces TaxID=2593676 RepID=UPI003695E157